MDRYDVIILHPELSGLRHPAQVPSLLACSRCERGRHRKSSVVRLTVPGIIPNDNGRKSTYFMKVS